MTRLDPEHSGAQAHLDDEGNCQCVGGCCVDWLNQGGDPKDKPCVCPDCGGGCAPLPDGRYSWIRRFHRMNRS
jgi:hypothetical protein